MKNYIYLFIFFQIKVLHLAEEINEDNQKIIIKKENITKQNFINKVIYNNIIKNSEFSAQERFQKIILLTNNQKKYNFNNEEDSDIKKNSIKKFDNIITKKRNSQSLKDLDQENKKESLFVTRAGKNFKKKNNQTNQFGSQRDLEIDLENIHKNKLKKNNSGSSKKSLFHLERNNKKKTLKREQDEFESQGELNDSEDESVVVIDQKKIFQDVVLQILDEQGLHLKKNNNILEEKYNFISSFTSQVNNDIQNVMQNFTNASCSQKIIIIITVMQSAMYIYNTYVNAKNDK
jgi:hypothetical protein